MMQGHSNLRAIGFVAAMATAAMPVSCMAQGQGTGPSESGPAFSAGFAFAEKSGEQLFAGVCRGCHMADGKGATGAGTYPSLAGDPNLEASEYPLEVVVNGQRGMPPVGSMMSDDQVAAVVNYLRTHFGNAYQDSVTAADVKAVRR
jgi:mono/diheme cytochrome c family protein